MCSNTWNWFQAIRSYAKVLKDRQWAGGEWLWDPWHVHLPGSKCHSTQRDLLPSKQGDWTLLVLLYQRELQATCWLGWAHQRRAWRHAGQVGEHHGPTAQPSQTMVGETEGEIKGPPVGLLLDQLPPAPPCRCHPTGETEGERKKPATGLLLGQLSYLTIIFVLLLYYIYFRFSNQQLWVSAINRKMRYIKKQKQIKLACLSLQGYLK